MGNGSYSTNEAIFCIPHCAISCKLATRLIEDNVSIQKITEL